MAEQQEQGAGSPIEPAIEEFKGNKVLILNPGSRFPFSFGVTKAKMILDNLDAIRKFVEQYGNKK